MRDVKPTPEQIDALNSAGHKFLALHSDLDRYEPPSAMGGAMRGTMPFYEQVDHMVWALQSRASKVPRGTQRASAERHAKNVSDAWYEAKQRVLESAE